jgi:hypothetical protein
MCECGCGVVVGGLVQDDEIWAALIEVRRRPPEHGISTIRGQGCACRECCQQKDGKPAKHEEFLSDSDNRLGKSRPTLRLGFVHLGYLAAVSFTCSLPLTGGLDAADTAPALAGFGFDLAHLRFRVMLTTVVTECGFSHANGLKQ